MSLYQNVSGSIKTFTNVSENIGGSIKTLNKKHQNVGGSLKLVYQGLPYGITWSVKKNMNHDYVAPEIVSVTNNGLTIQRCVNSDNNDFWYNILSSPFYVEAGTKITIVDDGRPNDIYYTDPNTGNQSTRIMYGNYSFWSVESDGTLIDNTVLFYDPVLFASSNQTYNGYAHSFFSSDASTMPDVDTDQTNDEYNANHSGIVYTGYQTPLTLTFTNSGYYRINADVSTSYATSTYLGYLTSTFTFSL